MKDIKIHNKIFKQEAIIIFDEDIDKIAEKEKSLELIGIFSYLVLMAKTFEKTKTWEEAIEFMSENFNISEEHILKSINKLKNSGVLDIYMK